MVSVLAFYLTIRVQIPLKPTVFSVKFVFEKNENKQTEAGVGPIFKNTILKVLEPVKIWIILSHIVWKALKKLVRYWKDHKCLFYWNTPTFSQSKKESDWETTISCVGSFEKLGCFKYVYFCETG